MGEVHEEIAKMIVTYYGLGVTNAIDLQLLFIQQN